jgi:hypothetical protein
VESPELVVDSEESDDEPQAASANAAAAITVPRRVKLSMLITFP